MDIEPTILKNVPKPHSGRHIPNNPFPRWTPPPLLVILSSHQLNSGEIDSIERVKPGIHFTKIWFDEDIIELKIDVSDGISSFSNQVYVGYSELTDVVRKLGIFKDHVHGGLFDIRFGEFGPEYASGAFHARFHFHKPGRLYITSKQQSEFGEFPITKVASEATLYLKTEPALLDNFISELRSLEAKKREEAHLEGI